MKKILLGLSAILLCFLMASCGDSSTNKHKDKDKDKDKKEKAEMKGNPLESEVNRMKSEIPYNCGDGIKITKCDITGDFLEIVATYDESQFSLDDPIVSSIIGQLGSDMEKELRLDSKTKDLFELCKEEDKGFRLKMEGAKSKASVTLFEKAAKDL